ncbi:MAG: ABC transporter permease [Candidatus Cryptobacteroides sp.]
MTVLDASGFIARRMRFGGSIAVVSIAVSFFVMIIAVAVSSGFRKEIRDGISSSTGDIQLMPVEMNWISEDSPVGASPSYLAEVEALPEVQSITPAVYRAGIIKKDGEIHGAIFKGVVNPPATASGADSVKFGVSIPSHLGKLLNLGPGDRMPAYFIGETVKVRNFNIVSVYDGIMDGSDEAVVLADIKDLQRLNGWEEDEVSMLEVSLVPHARGAADMSRVNAEIGEIVLESMDDEDDTLIPTSLLDRYPQIFDWLSLLDFNVFVILILMTVVAGFNMVSGLLIMLFRNISTIGILKSMGMTDRMIAKVFLRVSSKVVLKGLAAGNALALAFCLLQGLTHLIKLNPENYFVSFVPVHVDVPAVILADIAAFAVILLILLIPCLFISRIDPSRTVRAQ